MTSEDPTPAPIRRDESFDGRVRAIGAASPPRVLLVGWQLAGGGASNILGLVAQHLFGGTAEVAVLSTTHAATTRTGQRLYSLRAPSRPVVLRAVQRLRGIVRAGGYDAVMAIGVHPNAIAWASVIGMGARRPALIMIEVNCPLSRRRLEPSRYSATSMVLCQLTYRMADLCAANSEDGVAETVRHLGVDPKRIRRLHDLVDPGQLAAGAMEADATDTTPSICVCARLEPQKRIETLLMAAAELPRDLAWRVDILGDGVERASLERLAARLQLAERVRFHGWVEDPSPRLRRALVKVLPSQIEGFSIAGLEAMALGTPVVMSFHSTDARRLSESGAVLGFPVGDHLALRDHLLRLLTDPDLARRLGAAGRRYAERHEVARALPAFEALVHDAIEVRARRSGRRMR